MSGLPQVSSQGERAAAISILLADKIGNAGLPNVRKIGRYAFFAPCAFGFGAIIAVLTIKLGIDRDVANTIASVVTVAAFLALRDMSKVWDLAVHSASEADRHFDALREALSEDGGA